MKRLLLTIAFLALAVNASAQNPFSLINFGATPVDTNSGTKSAGTLRVVIATDQPNLTTPWNVTFGNTTIAVTNAGTFATQAAQSGTWTVQPGNTANTIAWKVDGSAVTQPVSLASVPSHAVTNAGTFATQSAITAASGSIASGAVASGAIASGAVASGAYASGSISDGADVTLGAKGDAKSTATDTTAITIMSVLKEISAMEQAPASRAVTNAGTFATQNGPTTTGGSTACYLTSAASTNSTNCKASAGQIYGISLVNTTSTLYYLRIYNASSAPTCSSATGFIRTIPVPHNTGTGAGVVEPIPEGEAYATGIGFCLTGGGSSTDNTNAATGVYITIRYK